MFASPMTAAQVLAPSRPLGFPAELWAEMSEHHRSACTSAQALIGAFGGERTASLRNAGLRAGLSMSEALEGLRILDGMDLVSVEGGSSGPVVTLLALPEDHVRIVAPDHSVRWVFIARPLDAPEVDAENLN